MYKTILVPVEFDHNPITGRTLEVAKLLAAPEARMIALHVVEPVPTYIDQFIPEQQQEAIRQLVEEKFREELGGETDNFELALSDGAPGVEIVEYAKRQGVDCIVMASHKPGLADLLLGSTAARVVRHAECSVHVVR